MYERPCAAAEDVVVPINSACAFDRQLAQAKAKFAKFYNLDVAIVTRSWIDQSSLGVAGWAKANVLDWQQIDDEQNVFLKEDVDASLEIFESEEDDDDEDDDDDGGGYVDDGDDDDDDDAENDDDDNDDDDDDDHDDDHDDDDEMERTVSGSTSVLDFKNEISKEIERSVYIDEDVHKSFDVVETDYQQCQMEVCN